MYCWGNTVHGELGVGGIEEEHILIPRKLHFNHSGDVIHVACGGNHTVFVLNDGEVFSCGNNDFYQLGHSKPRKRPELIEALEAYNVTQASCGSKHTLVATQWGQLFSWGHDRHGQLGHGVEQGFLATPKIIKALATKQVVQIACGSEHCMALTNTGELYSWGRNQYGQLGLGVKSDHEGLPNQIKSLQGVPIAQVACGSNHSFVLSRSGAVFCWGKNSFGQLGLNDEVQRDFPVMLRALSNVKVKYVACGEDHTATLTIEGGVFTFGAGMYGQLGHSVFNKEIFPRKVMELMGSTVTQIACGRHHTLAYVPSRGRVYSFGLGGSGQLGVKTVRNCKTPSAVYGPWVSPFSPPSMELEGSAEVTYVIYQIYAGGDQCFAKVTDQETNTSPADYRKRNPKTQILTLAEEKARACNQLSASSDPQDLMSYIEHVFTSAACINASFLLDNDEHFTCKSTNHGVDIQKARRFFFPLSMVSNAAITELVETQLKDLIPTLSLSPPHVEALRLYLILPECHLFTQPSNFKTITCPLGGKLLNLKSEALKVIERWWRMMDIQHFMNLINTYKRCVVDILNMEQPAATHEIAARRRGLEVSMQVLERLNITNKNGDLIVPYETFYIPEITVMVDIGHDYTNWLRFKQVHEGDDFFFCNFSFLFDAPAKSMLLHTDTDMQMQYAVDDAYRRMVASLFVPNVATAHPFLVLLVSRENIAQDTVRQLTKHSGPDLKKPLKVVFFGEEAVDAGGVRKEFFLLLLKEILDPKYGMFKEYETRCIWFNEQSFEEYAMYHMIGILCGLAIYNGIIIALPFPLALYKKLLKEPVKLDDLKDLSPVLVKGLHDLLRYEADDTEEVFMLNFEITQEAYGQRNTSELIPDGAQVSVKNENKHEYVDLYVDFILNKSVERQFQEFFNGFHEVCGGPVVDLFHPHELMAMVVGNENYDWRELEENTMYKGEFTHKHPTIKMFWRVFHQLTLDEKKKFLMFLTGSDRIPILGMKSIEITIQSTRGGDEFFPVAHTCFNLLDLPVYSTERILCSKLLEAIGYTEGFSLA